MKRHTLVGAKQQALNRTPLLGVAILIGLCLRADSATPTQWLSRGAGAGGATFAPAFSPFNPDELYLACDMGELFHTTDLGASWSTVDFRQIQAFHSTEVQFTSSPLVLYVLDYFQPGGTGANRQAPSCSLDGGLTWTRFGASKWPYGAAYRVLADPQTTNRLVVGTWSNVYFTADGGSTFALISTAPTNRLAGAFFDGANIFVACSAGLLVSVNNGASFYNTGTPGIAPDTFFFSFSGAVQAGTTRFYCATAPSGVAIPDGIPTGTDYNRVYAMNWGDPGWSTLTNGFTANDSPVLVATARRDIATAYVGARKRGSRFPDNNSVFRTTNGGSSWTSVFNIHFNANIATGWGGDNPLYPPVNYSPPHGLAVDPNNADRVARSDQGGLTCLTTNGGASWVSLYVEPSDLNPTNALVPLDKAYHGNGLEPTACWWVHWTSPTNLLAAFSDIRLIRSSDGGASWAFDYTLTPNSNLFNDVWQILPNPTTNILYAVLPGLWTPNGVYNSSDANVDPLPGRIYSSADAGKTWTLFKDLGEPAVWMAIDPNHPSRMYVATVDSTNGAVWLATNLLAGAAASWQSLSAHPRTRGHPYNIHVLDDGSLLVGYGAGITTSSRFTSSSGVFLCTNLTAALAGDPNAWVDRSATGMVYWTQDVVLDPFDPGQNRWYAGVWNGWGLGTNGYPNPMGLGGLYKTANRGLTWDKVFTNDTVSSCTFNPLHPDELYVASHVQGLWCSTNINAATPAFQPVTGYPFRQPQRIFFNPYNPYEVWVTSNGNGLRVGTLNANVWITGIERSAENLCLRWQADRTNLTYAVESCTDLLTGDWSQVQPTSQWWVSRSAWTDSVPCVARQFFRVRARTP